MRISLFIPLIFIFGCSGNKSTHVANDYIPNQYSKPIKAQMKKDDNHRNDEIRKRTKRLMESIRAK